MDYEVAIWLFFCSFHTLREKRFKNISIQKHLKEVLQAKSLYEIVSEASLFNSNPSLAGQFFPSWSGHIAKITVFPLIILTCSKNHEFTPTLSGHVAKITFLPLIIGTSNHNSIFTPLLSGHLIKWYIYPSLLGHLPPKLWMLAENEKMSAGIFSNLMMIFFCTAALF